MYPNWLSVLTVTVLDVSFQTVEPEAHVISRVYDPSLTSTSPALSKSGTSTVCVAPPAAATADTCVVVAAAAAVVSSPFPVWYRAMVTSTGAVNASPPTKSTLTAKASVAAFWQIVKQLPASNAVSQSHPAVELR